jgi:hypothetical protein
MGTVTGGTGHERAGHEYPLIWLNLRNMGVRHTVALPFTLNIILLKEKKNYENPIISPCKNIIFKKFLYKKPKSFKVF